MTNRLGAILKYWSPVFLWMVVIFALSSISGMHLRKISVFRIDKLVHFVEFAILGYLLIRAFLNSGMEKSTHLTAAVLSVIIAGLYAVTDEWHQQFVPDRTPDFFDFIADLIGINIGILLYKKGE